MRPIPFLTALTLMAGFSVTAQAQPYYPRFAQPAAFDVDFHTGVGNSQGTLQWNIAGGNNGPNILSELTYKDVNFRQFSMASTIRFHRGWLADHEVSADFTTGTANEGTVQDSDYDGDNRSGEYSRSYSSAIDSSMSDFSIGIARRIHLSHFQVLKPMAGYTSKTQNMLMTEGLQTINTDNPTAVGPFRNALNSTYNTNWDAYWIGLGWGVETRHHQLNITAKYQWLTYAAEADWNLRSDFAHPKSFEQEATGTGYSLGLNYAYQVSNLVSLWINWQQVDWNTDAGQDTVFFADGTRGTTQLNEVSWQETGVSTGMVLRF